MKLATSELVSFASLVNLFTLVKQANLVKVKITANQIREIHLIVVLTFTFYTARKSSRGHAAGYIECNVLHTIAC